MKISDLIIKYTDKNLEQRFSPYEIVLNTGRQCYDGDYELVLSYQPNKEKGDFIFFHPGGSCEYVCVLNNEECMKKYLEYISIYPSHHVMDKIEDDYNDFIEKIKNSYEFGDGYFYHHFEPLHDYIEKILLNDKMQSELSEKKDIIKRVKI